jgi:integrase/recombinase XerD
MQVLDWRSLTFEREPQHKPKTTLTPEEIRRLVSEAKNLRDKAIIMLFFGTGCRSAEELNLDREQWDNAMLVDKENKVWEIWVMGKNQKYRPVHFYQDVKDAVDAYLHTRKDRFKPLFISQQNRRISYAMVSRMIHETTRQAGLDKVVTQHVFRHSYATEMGAAGIPLPLLAYELGHKDSTVTQKIYVHMDVFKTRKAYGQYHPK